MVVAKPILKETLIQKGLDESNLILILNVILTSQAIDNEHRPRAPSLIDELLKKSFIVDHVYSCMESQKNAEKILGQFASEKALFDYYWELKSVICIDVPITIEYET